MSTRNLLLLVGAVVAIAVLAGGGYYWWTLGHRSDTLTLPGVVEIQEVRLGSKIGGRVGAVLVSEGDMVEPGQLLFRLDTPELEAQKRQSEARLSDARAQLEQAHHGPRKEERAAAAAAVAAAQARLDRVLAGYRQQEIEQASKDHEAAEADLKLAREEYDRSEKLYRTTAGPRADFDVARASLDRSRAHLDSTKARLDMLLEGSRKEDKAESRAELRRVQANLDLLNAGTRSEEVEQAEAKVHLEEARLAEVEANLNEARVVAPDKAVVEVVAVRPGDLIAPNQAAIRVLRAADLWVKVYVPETELGKVRLHQKVSVTIDSYPGRRLTGEVYQIANSSEFTPRNVQSADERHNQVFGVRIRVDDPEGIFKSGMAADVILPLKD